MKDIIIIGAGPAGLTAALYALRAGKSVLVIEKSTFGGQVTFSPKIENYPGIPEMTGNEFADKLLDQVLAMGAEVEMEKVTGIINEGNRKLVFAGDKKYEAKAVIIAVGVTQSNIVIVLVTVVAFPLLSITLTDTEVLLPKLTIP